jgi:hypothetical protein
MKTHEEPRQLIPLRLRVRPALRIRIVVKEADGVDILTVSFK